MLFAGPKGFLMAKRKEETINWMISFTCWSCREEVEVDLLKAQDARLEGGMYNTIKPAPENPQQYYMKCTACNKFNTIYV